MQHLKKLLQIKNSNLAWVLRLNLYGLRTQLYQALKTVTDDPGNSVCQELLKELDLLLKDTQNSPLDMLEVEKQLNLKHIADSLISEKEVFNYLGEYKFYSTNDADLWNEIQRLLLRLPEKIADAWRENILKLASEVGVQENTELIQKIPFTYNEFIYPGLTGSITATGLSWSNEVNFDSRLLGETANEDIRFLAGIVCTYIKFIQLDPYLHHALKSVDRFGVRCLNSQEDKSKYIAALLDRFQRVQTTAAQKDYGQILRARLDLDEAIHSLVYLPPISRYSWWGKLQLQARRTLDKVIEEAREAGYNVQIRPLWGIYADVYNWSKDDLRLDVGGVRSEVSACLRVYAKINDELFPGRVIFRGS